MWIGTGWGTRRSTNGMRLEGPTPAGIGVRAMSAVHWHGRPLLSQDLVPVAIVLSDGGAPRALSPSPHAMHGIRLQLRSDQDVEESCQLLEGPFRATGRNGPFPVAAPVTRSRSAPPAPGSPSPSPAPAAAPRASCTARQPAPDHIDRPEPQLVPAGPGSPGRSRSPPPTATPASTPPCLLYTS